MLLCFPHLLFQIKDEFGRITTVPLEQTFLSKLDTYTPKLLEIFHTKCGVANRKIKPQLDSLSQVKLQGHLHNEIILGWV